MTAADSQVAVTPPASAASAQSRVGPDVVAELPEETPQAPAGSAFDISPRAVRAAFSAAHERQPGEPLYRPLRIYTLDPTASRQDGSVTTVNVPYEPLGPGPTSGLFEVIDEGSGDDVARTSGPLNLDASAVLLEQGVSPSAADPQFRAQMVYAVCSTTYAAFRQALGRDLMWGFMRGSMTDRAMRLRVRSSYADDRNAYYESTSGELRFGAFVAEATVAGNNVPYALVYTSLQHDVVVHEMSHALLDGLRAHLLTPTNPDVYAFHEAFADLVALFQRFTYDNVVRAGIRAGKGDLRASRLLTDLALQFGQTVGRPSALRSAIIEPDRRHEDSEEPHKRGEVLAAAVFEAFTKVYAKKTERAVRLASGGTGVLPQGELPDLLVDELTGHARKLAGHFLEICIRAIDYCPPVDLTFGEYLRALITADMDVVPDDPWLYREAVINAFRSYGIYPRDVRNLSEDTLRWSAPGLTISAVDDLSFATLRFRGEPGRPADLNELTRQANAFGRLISSSKYLGEFGLRAAGVSETGDRYMTPVVESIRTARRAGPDGQIVFDLVAEVIQRRVVQATADRVNFDFYGGATVILDPSGKVRYVIRKRIDDEARLSRQATYIGSSGVSFWQKTPVNRWLPRAQPFRFLHASPEPAAPPANPQPAATPEPAPPPASPKN